MLTTLNDDDDDEKKDDPDDFDIEVGLDRLDGDRDDFAMDSPVATQGKTHKDGGGKPSLHGISRMNDGAFSESLRPSYFGESDIIANKKEKKSKKDKVGVKNAADGTEKKNKRKKKKQPTEEI